MDRATNILVDCYTKERAHNLAKEFAQALYEFGMPVKYYDYNRTVVLYDNYQFHFTSYYNNPNKYRGFKGERIYARDIRNLISELNNRSKKREEHEKI